MKLSHVKHVFFLIETGKWDCPSSWTNKQWRHSYRMWKIPLQCSALQLAKLELKPMYLFVMCAWGMKLMIVAVLLVKRKQLRVNLLCCWSWDILRSPQLCACSSCCQCKLKHCSPIKYCAMFTGTSDPTLYEVAERLSLEGLDSLLLCTAYSQI